MGSRWEPAGQVPPARLCLRRAGAPCSPPCQASLCALPPFPRSSRCKPAPAPADYALSLPHVYFVTMRQLLGWLRRPTPAAQLTPAMLGCGNAGGVGPEGPASRARSALTAAPPVAGLQVQQPPAEARPPVSRQGCCQVQRDAGLLRGVVSTWCRAVRCDPPTPQTPKPSNPLTPQPFTYRRACRLGLHLRRPELASTQPHRPPAQISGSFRLLHRPCRLQQRARRHQLRLRLVQPAAARAQT